ncbi:hypothetical protein AB3480_34080 [Rhizobium mongolense]|uniref:hypothetical protein n=1 Tax=Rhizobium mongolense TaxID=57676 RepID=UPI0034A3CE7E
MQASYATGVRAYTADPATLSNALVTLAESEWTYGSVSRAEKLFDEAMSLEKVRNRSDHSASDQNPRHADGHGIGHVIGTDFRLHQHSCRR